MFEQSSVLKNTASMVAPGSSREQVVVRLWRHASYPQGNQKLLQQFPDGEAVSADAREAVAWAVHAGIIMTDGRNCLNPTKIPDREETAAMAVRYVKRFLF